MDNDTFCSRTKVVLSGNSIYEYCPYCVDELKKRGVFYKDEPSLKPLTLNKGYWYIQEKNGVHREVPDSRYECGRCGTKNITADTFVKYYCARSDGTKYTEQRKEPGLVWSMQKNKLVPAKYDAVNKKWVEM